MGDRALIGLAFALAHLRRVVFPEPVRVLDVANGLVLAVVTDEMEVENVALFELSARK